MNYLENPKPLSKWLSSLGEIPGEGALYIKRGRSSFTMDMLCWPEAFDSDSFSQEDFDLFEVWLGNSEYTLLLNVDEIEQIIENLKQQQANYSEDTLLLALEYYWKNDAFITI